MATTDGRDVGTPLFVGVTQSGRTSLVGYRITGFGEIGIALDQALAAV